MPWAILRGKKLTPAMELMKQIQVTERMVEFTLILLKSLFVNVLNSSLGRDSSIKPFKHPTKREITYAVGGCFSCCKRRTTLKPWSLFEVSKVEAFEAIVFFGDGSEEARSKFELISAPKSGHFGAKYAIARTPQNGKIFLVKVWPSLYHYCLYGLC